MPSGPAQIAQRLAAVAPAPKSTSSRLHQPARACVAMQPTAPPERLPATRTHAVSIFPSSKFESMILFYLCLHAWNCVQLHPPNVTVMPNGIPLRGAQRVAAAVSARKSTPLQLLLLGVAKRVKWQTTPFERSPAILRRVQAGLVEFWVIDAEYISLSVYPRAVPAPLLVSTQSKKELVLRLGKNRHPPQWVFSHTGRFPP